MSGVKDSLVYNVKNTAAAVGKLDGEQQPSLVAQTAQIVSALKDVSRDLSKALDQIANKRTDEEKARTSADDDSTWMGGMTGAGREVDWSSEVEEAKPHVFPAPVGEYTSMVKDSSRRMKPDYMNDVLVEDLENKGTLVLVKDPPAVRDGTSYVVPSVNYFRSEQDYINYSNYFDCSDERVGYVWINKPAVVEKVTDGWKLVDKGVLEVRL